MTKKQYLSVLGMVLVGFLIRTAALEFNLPHIVDRGSTLHQGFVLVYCVLLVAYAKVAVRRTPSHRRYTWFYTLILSGAVLNLLEVTVSGVVNFIPVGIFFGTLWQSVGDIIINFGIGGVLITTIKEIRRDTAMLDTVK